LAARDFSRVSQEYFMGRPVLAGLAVAFAALAGPALAQTLSPAGTWLTQDRDARIRISHCGRGLCGAIVWLRDPLDDGKPSLDKNNPNPALRKRPLLGLRLFHDMAAAGRHKWKGHIYNSDDGKTYAGGIEIIDRSRLRVEGCVGELLCGSETWTRVR
jgi:uncharacterized protein (DUF2147 family)